MVAAPGCDGFSSASSVSHLRSRVAGAVAAGGVLFSGGKAGAEEAKSSKQAHMRPVLGCGRVIFYRQSHSQCGREWSAVQ